MLAVYSIICRFISVASALICLFADSRTAVALLKSADTSVITGLLKLYLRELPEALFTDALYPKLVEGMGKLIFLHVHSVVHRYFVDWRYR